MREQSFSDAYAYIVLHRTFHIAHTRTRIPFHYFCIGQESKSEWIPESVTSNVNEPLNF